MVSDDVANAWYAVELLQKRIPSLVIERTAAESNYRVQQEKYRSGLSTSLEVQTAIRDLARSRADLVASTYDLEVAYRDLETVLAEFQSERIDQAMRRLLAPVSPAMPVKLNP